MPSNDFAGSTFTLGERLRWLRDYRQLSGVCVAEKTGLSQGYISNLEVGTAVNPTLKTLHALSGLYGVSLGELFAEQGCVPRAELDRLPGGVKRWLLSPNSLPYVYMAMEIHKDAVSPSTVLNVLRACYEMEAALKKARGESDG